MAFTTPSPYFFACFPLQEYFVNKDTGFPLAAGVVEFFSDAAFTVPKDVYQQNQSGSAGNYTYTYVNLGSKLVLSSVGTFVDNNGNDIIPFLYPFTGTPPSTSIQTPTGDLELYFIRVWSKDPSIYNDAVLQFTRSGWPPNYATTANFNDDFESTSNIYSNPQFSEILFTPTPATNVYTYTVTGATSLEIAPGWTLSANTGSSGDIRLKQVELNNTYLTEPSYAIQIDTDLTVTDLKLIQRINESPRILYNQYVSCFLLARCLNNVSVDVTTTYIPSSGSSTLILQGVTTDNSEFTELSGVAGSSVYVGGTVNTNPPSTGYVDLVTEFPSGRVLQFTSFQAITVKDPTSLVPYIEQSTPQMTNALFWYYKPELEYKPIPSYTLGWDFAMNPFQAQGTGAFTYNPSSPGKSVYVADQTILFQNTVDSVTVSKVNNKNIRLAMVNNTTATALVQYLGPNEAQELLNNPVCSMIRGSVSSGTLVGQINLYYTTAALPTLAAAPATGGYSLVSAVNSTTAAPTVGGGLYGTWTKVNRSDFDSAYFTLTTTPASFGFNGWDATGQANISSATFFAIVVTFADYAPTNTIDIDFVSLQKGTIPTPPAALSFGETLAGLQQYYEKSYDWDTAVPSNTLVGALGFPLSVTDDNSTNVDAWASSFTITYKASKRAIPTPTLYSPNNSASNTMYATVQVGANQYPANKTVTDYFSVTPGKNCANYNSAANNNNIINVGAYNIHNAAWANVQWVADARFGII
jgi:hypothetical protein